MDELETIAKQMELLINNDDTEVAHSEADGLLYETIEALKTEENAAVIDRILDHYSNIGKWYA